MVFEMTESLIIVKGPDCQFSYEQERKIPFFLESIFWRRDASLPKYHIYGGVKGVR